MSSLQLKFEEKNYFDPATKSQFKPHKTAPVKNISFTEKCKLYEHRWDHHHFDVPNRFKTTHNDFYDKDKLKGQ